MSNTNPVHNLLRYVGTPEHSDEERELLVETDHSTPEVHIGVWFTHGEGTYLNLTPEQALELGENLVARATALLED